MRLTDEQRETVIKNLGLAHAIAQRYYPFADCKNDEQDILQAAMIGLCRAVARHDPGKGALSTCAWAWCRLEIQKYFRQRDLIRIPAYLRRKAHAQHRHQKHTKHSVLGSAFLIGIPAPQEEMPISDDERDVFTRIKSLSNQERFVVGERRKGRTFQSIGQDLGLTRERIRQIQLGAIRKAKEVVK